MMLGPHSPVENLALTGAAESQAEFDTVEPTSSATETFNAELRAAMLSTVWTTGCDSWYLGKDGLPEVWPFTPAEHRAMLAKPTLWPADDRVLHLPGRVTILVDTRCPPGRHFRRLCTRV
jgi:hypothetical protein